MSILKKTLVGLLLGTALIGNIAVATAAPCYFGECGTQTPDGGGRRVTTHGSWTGLVDGKLVLVLDSFNDGSKFGIALSGDGRSALLMTSPDWTLTKGQRVSMRVDVDGEVYSGTAVASDATSLVLDGVSLDFVKAIHNGRRANIKVGTILDADMTTLADGAATLDETLQYVKTAAE